MENLFQVPDLTLQPALAVVGVDKHSQHHCLIWNIFDEWPISIFEDTFSVIEQFYHAPTPSPGLSWPSKWGVKSFFFRPLGRTN